MLVYKPKKKMNEMIIYLWKLWNGKLLEKKEKNESRLFLGYYSTQYLQYYLSTVELLLHARRWLWSPSSMQELSSFHLVDPNDPGNDIFDKLTYYLFFDAKKKNVTRICTKWKNYSDTYCLLDHSRIMSESALFCFLLSAKKSKVLRRKAYYGSKKRY